MEYIPFEILRQLWGEYVLPNDIRVRARPSVAYVYRENEDEDISVHFETGISVSAPEEHRGDPEENPDDIQLLEEYKDFERRNLPRAFYLVDDADLLIVKAYPNRILRYDGFHDNGQPMIEVRHTVGVNAVARDRPPKTPIEHASVANEDASRFTTSALCTSGSIGAARRCRERMALQAGR
jgi:hypothetical protein